MFGLEISRTKRYYGMALVVLSLVLSVAAATYAAGDAVLAVDQAASKALENDLSAQLAELNLQSARLSYEKSQAQNLLSDSAYNERVAESNLRTAQIAYEDKQADIMSATVSSYFAVLSDQLDVEIKEAQLKVAQLTLDSTERKAKVGTASRLDVLDAQVGLKTAELSLAGAKNKLNRDRSDLLASLGMSASEKLDLQQDVAVPEVDYDLQLATQKAVLRSSAVLQAKTNLELAKLDLERAQAEGVAPLDLKAAQISVRKAQLNLQQALRNVRDGVASAYNSLSQAKDTLDVREASLAGAVARHDLILQQFKAGLKTEAERIGADISLAQAKQSHLSSVSSYYGALLSFQKQIGEATGEAK